MKSESQKTGSLTISLEARGWLTEDERKYLYWSAEEGGEGCSIVNIGVEYGASVVCLAEGAHENCMIYAFDIDLSKWESVKRYDNVAFAEQDSGKIVKDFFEDQIVSKWIDLLFVDGDHSYKGVKRDLLWLDLVKPGGTAIFHDCYEWPPAPPRTLRPGLEEIDQAVSEWIADEDKGKWQELDPVDSMRVFRRL